MKKKISLAALSGLELTETGLSDADHARQLSRCGENTIVERKGNPLLEIARETAKDPMIWFLLGIGTTFYFLGEIKESIVLGLATAPLLLMDAYLHWRTQASTSALKGQLASQSVVLRNGHTRTVNSHSIVPGDLVILDRENHFLPADGYWEVVDSLQIDESVLTGEAFPIIKKPIEIERASREISVASTTPASESMFFDTNTLGFAGTRVLSGRGQLRVALTGQNTAYGEIVQSVSSIPHQKTALQKSITHLTRILIWVSAVFCLILALVRLYQGHGLMDAILSAATLAVAAIPEEFPVVFTFFLGVGVFRLAKARALVRRAVSVENVGRINRICSDKTGTMTAGQLKLTHIDCHKLYHPADVIEIAATASDPFGSDPIDEAIYLKLSELRKIAPTRTRVIPFTEDRKRETAFFQKDGHSYCSTKGAPETILSKTNLSRIEKEQWLERTNSWARNGHKVLAVAVKQVNQAMEASIIEPELEFQFSGLLAFEDPARPEVKSAIQYCKTEGIQVLMITGDHPYTAAAIARDIELGGLEPRVISAESNPEKFEADWLKKNPEYLRQLDVIARCNPIQKLRIVEALKYSGELVAVTGDGVNDVPALKAADIGIAMGLRGSRSAKEVSSIILADDNFSTIVRAIREGRQLFANLRTSFEYILLIHIPFVISAAIIPLLGYPILYLPAHIVWLELIIHPTALFAFQKAAGPAEPPFKESSPNAFFRPRDWWRITAVGAFMTSALIYSYLSVIENISEPISAELGRSRSLVLLSFWSAGVALFLSKGELRSTKLLATASALSTILIVQIKPLAAALHLQAMTVTDWFITTAIVLSGISLLWILKYQDLRHSNDKSQSNLRIEEQSS